MIERIEKAWQQLAERKAGQETLLWGLFLTCVVQAQTEGRAHERFREIVSAA